MLKEYKIYIYYIQRTSRTPHCMSCIINPYIVVRSYFTPLQRTPRDFDWMQGSVWKIKHLNHLQNVFLLTLFSMHNLAYIIHITCLYLLRIHGYRHERLQKLFFFYFIYTTYTQGVFVNIHCVVHAEQPLRAINCFTLFYIPNQIIALPTQKHITTYELPPIWNYHDDILCYKSKCILYSHICSCIYFFFLIN